MYDIKITGNLLANTNKDEAIQAFAKNFKLSEARAQAVLDKSPMIIKKGVDKSEAEKFSSFLSNIGIEHILEPLAIEDVSVTVSDEQVTVDASGAATQENLNASENAETNTTDKPQVNEATPENFKGLNFSIEGQPDYSFITVQLPAEETLRVEASAMATMDTNLVMKTKAKGGLGRFITGESIFINEFTAENGPGEIGIAAAAPGDIKHLYLDNETVYLQNGAFVASSMGIETESKWQGMTKGFFSGESFFLIRSSGQGDLWFNTYGALIEIDVSEDYVVDTGNIVAFTDGLEYEITKVGGYKSLFFSGEGFVCRFKGQGKVWIQTRGVQAFTSWAHWYRPVKKNNG